MILAPIAQDVKIQLSPNQPSFQAKLTIDGINFKIKITSKFHDYEFQPYDVNLQLDWSSFIENILQCEMVEQYFIAHYNNKNIKVIGKFQVIAEIYRVTKRVYVCTTPVLEYTQLLSDTPYFRIYEYNNWKNTKCMVKLVTPNQQLPSSDTDLESEVIPDEIVILQTLNIHNCPNIIKIKGFYNNQHGYSISYSYGNFIELQTFLKQKSPDQKQILHIMFEILKALIIFDELKITHNDLNLQNILINKTTLAIRINGFTFSAINNENHYTSKQIRSGTIGFIAPETFLQPLANTPQANMYQFGIILFYLLCRKSPFGSNRSEIYNNNVMGSVNFAALSEKDDRLITIVKNLLQHDPEDRPTPKQLLARVQQLICLEPMPMNVPVQNNLNLQSDIIQNEDHIQNLPHIHAQQMWPEK